MSCFSTNGRLAETKTKGSLFTQGLHASDFAPCSGLAFSGDLDLRRQPGELVEQRDRGPRAEAGRLPRLALSEP